MNVTYQFTYHKDVHNELIFLAGKVIDAFFPMERPFKNLTHPKTKACHPPLFCQAPPLNLQVVRAALFWQFPLYIIFRESPLKIGFLGEPSC